VPRRGLIGPWAHIYPQDGSPGPAIGFLQEALRWWDRWLKGVDTGIMDEPMLRAYLEEWSPPATWRDPAPGRWVGEAEWPSPRLAPQRLAITAEGLRAADDGPARLAFRSPQWVGAASGEWMGTGVPGEMPADQRIDDGLSLVFDSEPLGNRLEILGAPEIVLDIAADKIVALLAARLCDVAPDGSSRRVSYGVLNLTHRESHAAPQALEPGRSYRVRLQLNDCGYAFPTGHRIRLALSTAYWPQVWPSPEAATLTLATKGSALVLPVRPPRAEDAAIHFAAPERGPRAPATKLRAGRMQRERRLDLVTGTATYITSGEGGVFGEGVWRFDETGTAIDHALDRSLTVGADDPLTARALVTQSYELGREGWQIRIETRTEMTATVTHFRLTGALTAYANGALELARTWDETIPRDLL
jgi:predicted acyl esterase